ncbi:MAG: flagellin, partial [Candidatus Anammoxibacter sp.]
TATVVNGSAFTITATGGESLKLAIGDVTTDATASDVAAITGILGFGEASAMFGSGTDAQAVTNFNGESSAIAKAVAINSLTETTGVTATAQKTTITADNVFSTSSLTSGDLSINGISIGASTTTLTSLIAAINLKTDDTGVTASEDSDSTKLVLTAKDGRNITLTFDINANTANDLGFTSNVTGNVLVVRGKIDLTSASTFLLEAATGDLTDLDNSFATDQSVTKSDDVITDLGDITGIQVDTQVNASLALTAIDKALDDVNNLRADLGAIQNRVEFTIGNLRIAGENMAAAESRIRDVDFASEVAIFTKNQILVQAGAAMLAQANTLPQIALQLLQ